VGVIEWRRILLQFPCYACGAPPGKECVTIGNQVAHTPHQSRTEQAGHHQWRLLEEAEPDPF